MSELGEAFEGWRAMKQAKRASNRAQSAFLLEAARIPFESKNDGAHLIVRVGQKVVDFWPGTGLWEIRCTGGIKTRRRGVFSLIAFAAREEKP